MAMTTLTQLTTKNQVADVPAGWLNTIEYPEADNYGNYINQCESLLQLLVIKFEPHPNTID